MKNTKKTVRIFALALAMLTALTFASCDASYSAEDEGMMDWEDNFSNGMAVKPEAEAPAENMDAEVEGEEVGDDAVQTPAIVENPFIDTAKEPVSTFSADVDTASYAYFRKLVTSGYSVDRLIGSGTAFRTEEFINYFKYDVPAPAENELFGVHSELVPCPWNAESMLLRLTLQAEVAKPAEGNNLVFLIDVSGSMASEDKLPLIKRAFSYLVGNLSGKDKVSIVTYSGREAVVLEGCSGLDSDRIMAAINSLTASGSTNGEAGLTKAYQLAETYYIHGGNNRIIMASDGDLNVGISSQSELTAYIEEKRDQGVYLSVLGFGTGNYKDSKMEALADNGNGIYYYIDGESEAEKVFGTDLLGTLYTVAEDVKLQLTFAPDIVQAYRLVGYENRVMANQDFEDDTKDAGEVGASHQVTVCYEIKLHEAQADNESSILTLAVRYKNPGEPISLLNEYPLGFEIVETELDEDMRFICAVVETCMVLRQSTYLGDITLDGILEELDSLDLSKYPEREEFRELVRQMMK